MENQKLLQEILKNTKQITTRLDHIEQSFGQRLDHVEQGFGSRLDHIKQDFGSRLDHIEQNFGQRLDVLEHIGKEHGERLQNIENIVTRIEKDHGDKIQVLFDYFVDQDSKNKKISSKLHKLCKKSDEHDTRIFALEFYKEKLASK